MTAFKHWARYWMPGSFFSEDEARQLPERSVEAAVAAAPEYAFAFELYDTAICEFEFDASLFKVVPIPQDKGERHFIGGEVFTSDELRALAVAEGEPDKYRTLIANVDQYDGKAIRCRTNNWQPFQSGDVLVECSPESRDSDLTTEEGR